VKGLLRKLLSNATISMFDKLYVIFLVFLLAASAVITQTRFYIDFVVLIYLTTILRQALA